jgi:diguanylate cyclase (GGDEF)-like protein/PAS domain S-box-containing protein
LTSEVLRENEELFRLIAENIGDLVALLDSEGRRLYNSPSYRNFLGEAELAKGSNSFSEIHPDDREGIETLFRETVATGIGRRAEFRFLLKDGSVRYIESQGNAINDADGKVAMVLVVSRDMTERRAIEMALRESEERFRSMANSLPALIWVCGPDQLCSWVNNTWLAFTGRRLEEEVGSGWSQGIHPEDASRCLDIYMRQFAALAPFELEYRLRRHDGNYRWMINTGIPRIDASGNLSGYICTLVDITDRKLMENELKQQARMDYLTGIFNRRHLVEQGEIELARAIRYGKPFSLLMLDIDHFKQVNDAHGHRAGDRVLVELGGLLNSTMREVDVVARMGGEEFAILLPETDGQQAAEVAERLRRVVAENPVILDSGTKLQVTVSIGVASLDSSVANIDILLNRADDALYRAKETGRNKVCAST